MKNLAKIFCLGIISIFYSCGIGKWDISELYALKIEGSSKIIYKYDAWGGLDSNANGYIILDSTKTFKINVREELPFFYLREIPTKKKISGVTHKCYNTCGENYYKSKPEYIPVEKEKITKEKIEIENSIYQYRGFSERSGGLESFYFETFREERDSIFFYNLENVRGLNKKYLDSLKLKKRMVLIQENDSLGIIKKLIIEDLIINEKSNEIISNKTYFLTPKNKIKSGMFSDFGIFKPVKIE